MIKKFYAICFILLSLQVFSQNVETMKSTARFSTDAELTSYINKAKSSGLSLIEVEGLVKAQGATLSELSKLRTLWNAESINSSSSVEILPDSPESSVGNVESTKIVPENSRRFGSNFFENNNISEVPQLFVATPSDYRLGPGDELIINLYGASENSYSVQISRNGTVKFDRLAPIYLSGLSIKSAKARLKNSLTKLYAGLASDDQLNKVDIDVSLQKARSVVINITGQVTAPGTYTISGFSSVLNALFAAGGPNEVGSFRNIKLLRNGKVSKTIDLYDYFVTGVYPNIYLRDQDVILVEAYNKLVDVKNGFKTNALFELNENETIEDLMNFSGGLSSKSYKNAIYVNRINDYSRSTLEIYREGFSTSYLMDGDVIEAKEVSDVVSNSVYVEGAVFLPGIYDLSKVSTVGELINSSSGLRPDANASAFLYRTNKGIVDEIVSINLDNQSDLDKKIFDQDRLVIISNNDLVSEKFINVQGEVNNPQIISFNEGITLRDAITMSNGFTDLADKKSILIIRNQSVLNNDNLVEEIFIDFSPNEDDNNIELYANDIVSVKSLPFFKPTETFYVQGEVEVTGSFAISEKKYNIKDAFAKDIRILESADIDGVYLERDSIKIPISGKFISNKFLPSSELTLKSNDKIFISKLNNTITVKGNVQQESIIDYNKGISFKNAISRAGGYSDNADRKRAYVEYQNGQKKSINNFLIFKFYPKLKSGSKIIVPAKNENRSKTSVGEIVGYTTSLVSIIALIKSL